MFKAWPGWQEPAWATVTHLVSWTSVCVVLMVLGVIRLLLEWQRRTTLVAVLRNAPGGSVVVQERGLGGPAMSIWVGAGPRPPAPTVAPPPVVLLPAGRVVVVPPDGHRG